MLDVSAVPDALLQPVAAVVTAILDQHPELDQRDLMVVGAEGRDILHAAQGHEFATAATHDLDLAIALRTKEDYSRVVSSFPRLGLSGIRYDIAETAVDLVPFGGIENPIGVAAPLERGESLSVRGMTEVHAHAITLPIAGSLEVRLPTPSGYAALKLIAWLDRREPRDAADLALAAYWYANDPDVEEALWAAARSDSVVVDEDFDVTRASLRQLGIDIATQVGPARRAELVGRWSGVDDEFTREFRMMARPGWTGDHERRLELIGAFSRGIATNAPSVQGLSP